MFKDIDKVADGISLVVTKADEGVDPQAVRDELMAVKKDYESSIESSTFKDPNLKKLFDITKMHEVFAIYETIEDATNHFNQ